MNFSGIDKILSKCDFTDGSIVNGNTQTILCSFALDRPHEH